MGLILTEKNEGMMERMMASGVQFSEVLVSTAIIQIVIHAIQATLAICVNYIYFDNPHLGGHFSAITMLMFIGIEGMILGFLIGAVCNTFMIAAYLAVGINIGYCFTSGLIWPLESAHSLLKIISPMLPITAPIKALLAITVKGMYFDSEPVYMGLLSIFCWSSFIAISIFMLGVGLNIGYSFTCGFIWPLESAHFLIKFIGPLLPITASIKTLHAITTRGLAIGSKHVYVGFLSIFGWSSAMIITLFVIGIFKKDL